LSSLGVYNRAYTFLAQPADLIGGVADKVLFPAMARIQNDNHRLKRAYLRATTCLALLAVPASVLLYILAPDLVDVLAGPRWSAVTGPFRVFAVVLLPRTLYKISGSLTRATGAVFGGASRQWLYSAEVVAGSAVGQIWGASGVAVGASLAIVAHFCVMLKFSSRIGNDLIRGVVLIHLRYGVVAAGMALACLPTANFLRQSGVAPAGVVGATVLVGLCAEAAIVFALRRAFEDELRFVRAGLRDVSRPGIAGVKRLQARLS
jgi:O-antigen/teichoic acid export membrane protein